MSYFDYFLDSESLQLNNFQTFYDEPINDSQNLNISFQSQSNKKQASGKISGFYCPKRNMFIIVQESIKLDAPCFATSCSLFNELDNPNFSDNQGNDFKINELN